MALVRSSQGTACDHKISQGYGNDVFLSFRGKDTGNKFTDHLYTALNNAGFLTFRDDDELERGEDIKPELQKAIQLSRASVVVFSKGYVSSRSCLNELVLILERKRTSTDHVVLPIFYDIGPSRIRKQTGSIQKAFDTHPKTQSPEKVKGWSEALAEVANLAGMVLENQADGYESKFIKKIVEVIGDKLSRTPLIVEPKLIGSHSQVEHINLWLQDGSTDVGIFVVYDIFGFGKTTIAKHVYNSNLRRFQGSIFIENIRETADPPNGLVPIQMQLLSTMLTGKEMKIHNFSAGIIEIEGAISSGKVLLVLGDVDRMDILDGVLKMKDQFYPGSKILITTRCKRLLKAHQVNRWGYHYDVFLNFRGEDNRKTFTDHLYTALISTGYRTFRDHDELETGEDIKSGLKQAIQMSRTSVIVFSKKYASSRWCLNELVEIVDHMRTNSYHVVIPVFYDIDPSHVRKQTGSFAVAFARHQKTEPPDMMERWRKALAEVADLAGKVLQNQAYGYESKFIEAIVKVISDNLRRTPERVKSKLIGIHSLVKDISLWLQDPSHNIGILFVYGMSGIGKTTIANCVYTSNFTSFEGSSYVESIRETASHPGGLVQIQKQILYGILNGKKEKIHNISEGIIKIGRAISSRRVLLVLDDVDHMDQLDAVLSMKDQLYPGTKIIITTRREMLLKAHEGIMVHKVGLLGFVESLELLSWHAFGQDHPLEGYEKYSEEVVEHSGGLPLALKVLGSSLFGEPKCVWQSTLEKLEVIPHVEIMNKLKIIYDSLQDDHDQELFLHIACFFIGKDEDCIVRILDGCDFKTICGIQNLRDRCLVTIDRDKKLYMHDMIREMGREIVRQESEEPGSRSRLWHSKDSFKVLREKNGTQAIEGLMLDMRKRLTNSPINSNVNVLEANSFARMHKLKLLCLRHVRLDGCYAELPTRLRWLCWPEFPLDSIPVDFSLEKLVVLEMQYSNLRQLCKRANFLPSLKILDVSHSYVLSEIIDFSLCPKLEELILVDCTSLIDVHESIGNLERLVYLNMKDCKNLRMLPKNMCLLKSLETLILSGCSNLDEFPVEMMKKMESLEVLAIDGIPLRPQRSSTILTSFPCCLVELCLKGCNLSDDVFPTDLSNLSYLRSLHLDENPICSLPVFIKGLRRLDHLSFRDCNKLESLVGLPKVHQTTRIDGCISLRKIKYLSPEQQSSMYWVGSNYSLVEWEHDYKLEPIDRVDVEIIKLLGLCNLESMPAVRMNHPCTNRDTKMVSVQGLYQYGIFSTFFAWNEVPGQFNYKSTKSSISFIVPLPLASHRIRGLNIFATYTKEENSNYDNCGPVIPILTKVSNKSKGLKWIYVPDFYGIPGEGEDMIWLSHWKMENETILQCGDQAVVSVVAGPNKLFRIKEFGVEIAQEHQNNMMITTQHNTKSDPNYPFVIGGDLSMYEPIPGIYFPGYLKEHVENTRLFPRRFLNRLIMDTDEEDTDEEEGQEDEPDYTIGRTRDATNNCGLRGWKVLLPAAGLFFTLALVVRSSISQKKKPQ